MSASPKITRLGEALPENCGICVINLDYRTDRWVSFENDMLPHLAPREVRRIPAVEGIQLPGYGQAPYFRSRRRDRTWAARAGCTLSHRKALQNAYEAGWSHALILEDDIHMPRPPDEDNLLAIRNALKTHTPGICYFGFTDPIPPFRELAEIGTGGRLHQVFGCNTAHAYLVPATSIRHILSLLPESADIWRWLARHRAIDRFFYRNLSPKLSVAAISPSLIDQKPGFSDILGRAAPATKNSHCTEIPIRSSDSKAYQAESAKQANSFRRADLIDALRGAWKRFNGF